MPEWVGRYRVREVLGTGAFATVYRATDEHLDADVAVKVLAENHSLDPEIRARFIEEGRRLRRLRSPHLTSVYDLGDTEQAQPFLVLEWADRGDLASRVAEMRQQGRVPGPGDILAVARALAAALRVLHRHHIVHRDLAPRNVLLGSTAPSARTPPPAPSVGAGDVALPADDERLMLTDLGLSKDLAAASGLTAAAGTSGFAPPEQRDAGTVDQRADVWAASALVVWLICDRTPDTGGNWKRELRDAGWPAGLVAVLARGLADSRDRRHDDIDEWLGAVEDAVEPSLAAVANGAAASDRGRFGHGRLWLASVVAALLVGGGIGVAAADSMDGPTVRTEWLENGDLRTVVEEHDITIGLEGPTEAVVGEAVRLSAEVSGAQAWEWIGPDGAVYPGQATIELVPAQPGRGMARLLAFDRQGRVVEATHVLQVPGDAGRSDRASVLVTLRSAHAGPGASAQ